MASNRRLLIVLTGWVGVSALFAAWLVFAWGGTAVTQRIDNIGETEPSPGGAADGWAAAPYQFHARTYWGFVRPDHDATLAPGATVDFAFGGFRYQGLEQHFWQPFEVRYRFRRARLQLLHLRKLHLSWQQFAGAAELKRYKAPWDWLFVARRPLAG